MKSKIFLFLICELPKNTKIWTTTTATSTFNYNKFILFPFAQFIIFLSSIFTVGSCWMNHERDFICYLEGCEGQITTRWINLAHFLISIPFNYFCHKLSKLESATKSCDRPLLTQCVSRVEAQNNENSFKRDQQQQRKIHNESHSLHCAQLQVSSVYESHIIYPSEKSARSWK